MAELRMSLEKVGFADVRTYIQSGNILFSSDEIDSLGLAQKIEKHIEETYSCIVPTLVLNQPSLQAIVDNAPSGWGSDPKWKYNSLFLLPPYDREKVIASIGILKPDIETITPGEGVLYQSMSIELFGRTTTGKLAGVPIYQRMTIRNWNTTRKLAELLRSR